MTGQVGAQLKLPVSAVPQGSGQGAHDPGNEPRTGGDGPESQECSKPVGSNGKGAQQLPGVPGHKPTSEEEQGEKDGRSRGVGVEVRPGAFLLVDRSSISCSPHSFSARGLPFKAPFPFLCPTRTQESSILTRGVQEK